MTLNCTTASGRREVLQVRSGADGTMTVIPGETIFLAIVENCSVIVSLCLSLVNPRHDL